MGEAAERLATWQELTKAECFRLLAEAPVGRVAVVDDLGPLVVPVNYVIDRHTVVFRTGEGAKLDAAARRSRVAFQADGIDTTTRTGWSVVIRGEAVEVTGPAELARLRGLGVGPWAPGARDRHVRILPAIVTGRRISAAEGPSAGAGTAAAGTATAGSRRGL
jgi:nitroimidazol reductase NimA-like FMN-containing flavoprotein (pyridoxamine 5'-phosphate oxidase superfamily)